MRNVRLNLRLTLEERQLIQQKAAQVHLKTSTWVRMVLLQLAKVKPPSP